ncbi:hypothetical protein DICVIV_13737 [Dictyocaulus viviparus]|uniref:Uncharacterized protein n=1 Tax=Dictyocaulus viviparus TaxID=29172 RepID=A0A0D8XD27_DICVI|nr:hypothetical protein DICVIV_13737 [Dictyocaulus viviparus]
MLSITQDMEAIDTTLPGSIRSMILTVFNVVATIAVIMIATPTVTLPFIFLAAIYITVLYSSYISIYWLAFCLFSLKRHCNNAFFDSRVSPNFLGVIRDVFMRILVTTSLLSCIVIDHQRASGKTLLKHCSSALAFHVGHHNWKQVAYGFCLFSRSLTYVMARVLDMSKKYAQSFVVVSLFIPFLMLQENSIVYLRSFRSNNFTPLNTSPCMMVMPSSSEKVLLVVFLYG